MRIALVCPYSLDTPGGVARHVTGLAGWLREQGQRALVIAPGTGRPAPDTLLLGRATPLAFNGSVAQLALSPAQTRRAVAALAGADIVHVHEPLTPGLAYATARAGRGRLVVTHHAHFEPGRFAPVLRVRASALPRRTSVAVSNAAAATARAVTGVEPLIIPNAIAMPDPVSVAARRRMQVAFVGRLDEPRKGYSTFCALADEFPEVDFVAAGPGRTGHPRIKELGQVSDATLSEVLAASAVLVAPNLYGESFGMVLVEALAHGCSVVASSLPAFRDVVDDDRLVTWFDPHDTPGAIAALRMALSKPPVRGLARETARAFTWDVVGPQVLAAYERG